MCNTLLYYSVCHIVQAFPYLFYNLQLVSELASSMLYSHLLQQIIFMLIVIMYIYYTFVNYLLPRSTLFKRYLNQAIPYEESSARTEIKNAIWNL